jgi:hypothetical protein
MNASVQSSRMMRSVRLSIDSQLLQQGGKM